MMRSCRAFLVLIAFSVCTYADCQPGRDFRTYKKKQAGIGVEVVDVVLGGATTVDSAELTKVEKEMIGSCVDDKQSVANHLYDLFGRVPRRHLGIEDLKIEPISAEISPTPVQVRGNVVEGETKENNCPADLKPLHQFLLDHRSNSLEADPECVDKAFGTMSFAAMARHSRFYTKALVDLLDFERLDQEPGFSHHFVKYPATESLHFPGAVPYLIDAIKRSDSEVSRTNAADVLTYLYRECRSAAATRLIHEGDTPETTPEQRTRLQTAAEYVRNYFGNEPGPCRSENGEPSSEEAVQRELERRWGRQ